jgi:hypothetical protein
VLVQDGTLHLLLLWMAGSRRGGVVGSDDAVKVGVLVAQGKSRRGD